MNTADRCGENGLDVRPSRRISASQRPEVGVPRPERLNGPERNTREANDGVRKEVSNAREVQYGRRRPRDGIFSTSQARPGRHAVLPGLGAVAAAAVLAACGSAGGGTGYGGSGGHGGAAGATQPATASRGPVVGARKLAGIGTVLVGRSGRTIYSPVQEARGKILCTGSCLSFWCPVSVAPGTSLRSPADVSGARHHPPAGRRPDPAHLQRQAALHVPARSGSRPGTRQQLQRPVRQRLLHLACRHDFRSAWKGAAAEALGRLLVPGRRLAR